MHPLLSLNKPKKFFPFPFFHDKSFFFCSVGILELKKIFSIFYVYNFLIFPIMRGCFSMSLIDTIRLLYISIIFKINNNIIKNVYIYFLFQGRCNREKPPCKYFHPPQHLKDQLLINGRNHLALKNALMQQMGIAPGQPVLPGQVPTVVSTKTYCF